MVENEVCIYECEYAFFLCVLVHIFIDHFCLYPYVYRTFIQTVSIYIYTYIVAGSLVRTVWEDLSQDVCVR